MAAIFLSAGIFVAVLPFARRQLPEIWGFIPVYQSAIVVNNLVTAALLVSQFNMLRSPGVLVLSGGYFFTAFMALVHMLSFPGLFSATGLFGAGPQTTAWLYMFWHGGFALTVIGYAYLYDAQRTRDIRLASVSGPVLACVAAAALLTGALTALTTVWHALLPQIMSGRGYTGGMLPTVAAVWALNLLAIALVWRDRQRSLLHLWCLIMSMAWALDVALSAVFNHGRFDVGFYAGRAYGLLASSFVLVMLIIEHAQLYTQVMDALQGEHAERLRVQEKTLQLNDANERLERRVIDRTAELTASNEELRQEIVERKRAERALEQSREELRELATISSTAREEEKRRVARELHDELAQSMAALKVDMQILEHRIAADQAPIARKVANMSHAVDDMIAATRRIAADLRPAMLDDLGLVPACKWLVRSFEKRNGIRCELTTDPDQFELAEPYASTVYRVLQECLVNVARHAHATHVQVRLSYRAQGGVTLSVRDDGVGFDCDEARARKDDSFGLLGLRERAYLVRGQLRIESSPRAGTCIELAIPQTQAPTLRSTLGFALTTPARPM